MNAFFFSPTCLPWTSTMSFLPAWRSHLIKQRLHELINIEYLQFERCSLQPLPPSHGGNMILVRERQALCTSAPCLSRPWRKKRYLSSCCMTPKKVSKSFFANGQVGRISGADLISLLDTGKLLVVDTRPVEDWKMGSLSHRFSVIFDVGILQSSCCYLLCWCYIFCLGVIFNVRVRLPTQCFHSRLFCLHSHWRASCWRKRSGGGEKER